jgi:MFS family permease
MAGIILIFFSPNFPALAIGAIRLGAGAGLFGTSRFTTLMDIYPDRNGTALGVSSAIANGGMAAIPLGGGFVAIILGWRGSFGVLLPFFVLTTVGLWLSVPRVTSTESNLLLPMTHEVRSSYCMQ